MYEVDSLVGSYFINVCGLCRRQGSVIVKVDNNICKLKTTIIGTYNIFFTIIELNRNENILGKTLN